MRIKKDKLAFLVFISLSAIIMCNLNGIFGVYLGISAPFSPLILVLAILLTVLSKPKYSDFNLPYICLITFFGVFWFIGFNVSISNFLGLKAMVDSTRDIATSTILITAYYIYFKQIKDEENLSKHFLVILCLFIFTCLGGVLEGALGLKSIYKDSEATRTFGFFGNPNETGLQSNLTVLLALYLFLKRKIGFIFLFVAMSIGTYGAILSFSKSAMLLSIFILLGYIFYNILNFKKIGYKGVKRFGKLVVIVSSIMVFFVLPRAIYQLNNLTSDQMKRIKDLYRLVVLLKVDHSTTSDRTVAVEQGFGVYSERPVFGHGLNSFSQGDLFALGLGVHNTFLKILGEGGAISLFLWFVFLATYFIYTLKSTQIPDSFFVIGIIVVISFYFMVSHTVLSRKFVVPLLGVALTMMHYKRQSRSLIS